MAFDYIAGRAADRRDWFTIFESFMTRIGWEAQTGAGTMNMTLRSLGEAGSYTKLFATMAEIPAEQGYHDGSIRIGVCDDMTGIHNRQKDLETGREDFEYLIVGDKDFVNLFSRFWAGDGYDWDYAGFGCLADFTSPAPDESYKMAVAGRGETGIELDWLNDAWQPDLMPYYHPDAISEEPDTYHFADLPVEHDSVVVGQIPHISRQYYAQYDREYLVVRYSITPRKQLILRIK